MWNAIVSGMAQIFHWLHQFIIDLGVPENKEGLSYVLAIFIFTLIIRLLILPLNVSMTGGCLPALLPLPILFALYYVFQRITPTPGADWSFLFIKDVFNRPTTMWSMTSIILAILAALSTYIPSLLLTKSTASAASEDNPMNMGTMNIVMAGMMGFMSLQFQPMLVIYWIIGGMIQLGQTYFINYLPAKKKLAAKKAEEEAVKSAVTSSKAKKKKKK